MKIDRGFTLLELLITVGILAALTTVAVFTLNPVEQLKKSRDSRRLADLSTLFTATDFYLQETPGASMGNCTSTFYVSIPSDNGEASPTNLPSSWSYNRVSSTNLRKIDGTGWLPLNLASGTAGTALTTLPVDPTNRFDQNLYYGYGCKADGLSYTLSAFMESKQFSHGGAQDKTSTDGGPDPGIYEVGSNIFLSPLRPVGSWSFNEGSGSVANDSSGSGNTGTLTNGPAWVDGKIGKALSFDGIDDFVDVGDPTNGNLDFGTSSFSVETWIRPASALKEGGVVAKHDFAVGAGYFLRQLTTVFQFTIRDGSGNSANAQTGTISADTWYHVVGVIDRSGTQNILMYLNGSQVDVNNSSAVGNVTNANTLYFGRFALDYLRAGIDEVRIYNRALSADEVRAIYNATK